VENAKQKDKIYKD